MAITIKNLSGQSVYLSLLCLMALLILSFFAPVCRAQEQPRLKRVIDATPSEEEQVDITKQLAVKSLGPLDEFDRGVPITSVTGFLDAARKGDYERAAQYLDMRNLPKEMDKSQGPDLARQLKTVLDRGLLIDLELLSDDPKGHADDGLPSYRDMLGRIETPDKTYTLLLQRVPREDGVSIWKISHVTVRVIPELYQHFWHGDIADALSRTLPDIELLGGMLWQWVGILILMAIMFIIVFLPTWVVGFLLRRKDTIKRTLVARFITGPVRFLIWIVLVRSFVDLVSPTIKMRALLRAETLLIIAVIWFVIRIFDFVIGYYANRLDRSGRGGAVVLLRPVKIIVRLVICLAAVLIWLDNIGFSVTAILTGLGVGGIAIALAAQRTFEDLIGAAIIFFSQPVRLGDMCRFGDKFGMVEEIGLRATRIRTLDNTVVTVPNSDFSRQQIENYTARQKIWYNPRISLPYETPREKIRTIIDKIETLLRSNPEILSDSARIRFTEIGKYALHLDVFSYVNKQDYGEYLKVAEQLNFEIMEIVESVGAHMALPSQAMYLESSKDRFLKHIKESKEISNEREERKEGIKQ
jgi:MscS family membrane protein